MSSSIETPPAAPTPTSTLASPSFAPKATTLVRCARHRELDADVVCDKCGSKWCFACVTAGDERGVKWWLCRCSGRCNPLADERRRAQQAVFERRAFDVFAYPLRGEGKWLLLVGAFFFGLFDLFFGGGLRALLEMVATPFQPVEPIAGGAGGNSGTLSFGMVRSSFAIALAITMLGFQLSWVMTVVRATAKGKDEPPGFPDYVTFVESTLLPTWRVVVALALCVGPGIVALPFGSFGLVLGLLEIVAGVAVLPMMLTSVAIADSLTGVDVPRVLRSIRVVGAPYVGVAALFFAVLGLLFAGTTALSFVGPLAPFARAALAVYFAAVAGRVLGLLYAKFEQELRWY